jgi:hypothetical protein
MDELKDAGSIFCGPDLVDLNFGVSILPRLELMAAAFKGVIGFLCYL